jgi:hypothetical protein
VSSEDPPTPPCRAPLRGGDLHATIPDYRHPSANKNRPNSCPHKPDRFRLLLARTYIPATPPPETPLAPDYRDDPNSHRLDRRSCVEHFQRIIVFIYITDFDFADFFADGDHCIAKPIEFG